MKCLSFLSIMFLLVGCGVSGVQVDETQISRFKSGVTRYDQVLSELGKPSSRTVDSEGRIHLHYAYSFYSIKPESFLPIVGEHVGGMNESSRSVVISFNPDGVMRGSTFYKTKTEAAGSF